MHSSNHGKYPYLPTWSLRLPATICCLSITLLSGCTFWGLEGDGPISKRQAFALSGRRPGRISESQKKRATGMFRTVSWGGALAGEQEKVLEIDGRKCTELYRWDRDGPWIFDSTSEWGRRFRDGDDVSTNYGEAYTVAACPGFPLLMLWYSSDEDTFRLDSGEEYKTEKLRILGVGIMGYYEKVNPVVATGQRPAYARAPDAKVPYSYRSGCHILVGLVGWGRVNRRYYMQLLWIPIPLGSAPLPPETDG